jgi:hypothetical protein
MQNTVAMPPAASSAPTPGYPPTSRGPQAQGLYPPTMLLTTQGGGEQQAEPRWIVLVLMVLAVCILIPTALYLALRGRNDEPRVETPATQVTPVELSRPRDIGKHTR